MMEDEKMGFDTVTEMAKVLDMNFVYFDAFQNHQQDTDQDKDTHDLT